MRSPLGASAACQPRNSASAVQERRPSLHFLSGAHPNCPRGVAQPGSVPEWGSGGRGFESLHPDRKQLVHTSDDPSLGTPNALLHIHASIRACTKSVGADVSKSTSRRRVIISRSRGGPRPAAGCSRAHDRATYQWSLRRGAETVACAGRDSLAEIALCTPTPCY